MALADEQEGSLTLIAIDGNQAIATGSRLPLEGTVIGRVFATQVPEICSNFETATEMDAKRLAEGGLTSCMDVPLSVGDRRFGVLAQAFSGDPMPTEADLALLQAIGNCLSSHLLLQDQIVKLSEMAQTDPLTKLYNRRVFEERLDRRWTDFAEKGAGFSVAIVDLDHFKSINDTYGHDFGDEVLKAVAEALVLRSRDSDTVVRMGGEEFGIILDGTDDGQARDIAERMCDDISKLVLHHEGKRVKVTASIGIAKAETAHGDQHPVCRLADQALYKAKETGRNQVIAA